MHTEQLTRNLRLVRVLYFKLEDLVTTKDVRVKRRNTEGTTDY